MCLRLGKKESSKRGKRRESRGGKEQCSFCVLCNPGPGRKKQPRGHQINQVTSGNSTGGPDTGPWPSSYSSTSSHKALYTHLPYLHMLFYMASPSSFPSRLHPNNSFNPQTPLPPSFLFPHIKVRQIPWAVGSLHPSNNEAFVGLDS